MQVIYSPLVPTKPHDVRYSAVGDVLTVELDGITETFDFTAMPDGEASEIVPEKLGDNPIFGAKRENGVLTVTLTHYMGERPEREQTVVSDNPDSDPVIELEDEVAYQQRLDEWEAGKQIRKATL